MLDQTKTQEEADLWDEVNNPPEKTYDLFGQLVDLNIFKGAYRKGTRGAVPFDPMLDQRAQVIVKFYIQPLPEINVKYQEQLNYESPNWADWGKVTFPSIKAVGINDARETNNAWFRFARVPNGKKYDKVDKQTQQPTGEQGDEMTWKIVALFANEEACRAAYLAAGGTPANGNGHNAPQAVVSAEDAEKKNAWVFLEAIVKNVSHGKTSFVEVQEAVKAHTAYKADTPPYISKHYPVDSVETMTLITDITKLLPF